MGNVAQSLTGEHSTSPNPTSTITVSPGAEGGPAAGNSGGRPGGTGQPGQPGQSSSPGPSGSATPSGTASGSGGGPTPAPCADSALRLVVATAQAQYTVGDKPLIKLTVTNTSTAACTRDVGAAEQEALVYSGGQRLWSSNDCFPGGDADVRTIPAGQSLFFSVPWSGLTSQPQCEGARAQVRAGEYSVTGRIGTLESDKATFRLR